MFDAVEGSEVQDAGMKLTATVVLVGFQTEVRTPLDSNYATQVTLLAKN